VLAALGFAILLLGVIDAASYGTDGADALKGIVVAGHIAGYAMLLGRASVGTARKHGDGGGSNKDGLHLVLSYEVSEAAHNEPVAIT